MTIGTNLVKIKLKTKTPNSLHMSGMMCIIWAEGRSSKASSLPPCDGHQYPKTACSSSYRRFALSLAQFDNCYQEADTGQNNHEYLINRHHVITSVSCKSRRKLPANALLLVVSIARGIYASNTTPNRYVYNL